MYNLRHLFLFTILDFAQHIVHWFIEIFGSLVFFYCYYCFSFNFGIVCTAILTTLAWTHILKLYHRAGQEV